MIPITADGLARWRAEIELGVEFRDKEFGSYRKANAGSPPTTSLAGRNIDLFEQGASSDEYEPLLNLTFPIVKTIVPTMFFQSPQATAVPLTKIEQGADDAFYVSELVNQDVRDESFRFTETMQLGTWDSFVLGFGVVKIGYATEFGQDVLPTKQETRQTFRKRLKDQFRQAVNQVLEATGLKPPSTPEEPDPEQTQEDETIRSESAYIQWVDPFDFVVDPRARDLTDALWVAQHIRKTLGAAKRDRRYSKERDELVADAVDDDRIGPSFIEEFQTVDLWEIHYKSSDSPTGIRVLTMAVTQQQTKAMMHEDNVLDIGGWQYEWVTPNKHGHRLYPVSVISIARPLLDRVNRSFEALLEQIDKFSAKVIYNERIDKANQLILESPVIGARVKTSGSDDVRGAVSTIALDQLNAEVIKFLEYAFDFVILIVGLTRAQLTGLTTAQTATESQIGQAGATVRRTDESNVIARWANRVVTKFWRCKAQFQDLASVALVQEAAVPNPQTGVSTTAWYPPIDAGRAARLKSTRFRFQLAVGSIQKPNLEIIRAQFEQFVRALMEPVVTQALALEGKRLSASEILRQWMRFFSEYGLTDISKMVVPVQDPMMREALLNFGQKVNGTVNGAVNRSLAGAVPTYADQVSKVAGEKGQAGGVTV